MFIKQICIVLLYAYKHLTKYVNRQPMHAQITTNYLAAVGYVAEQQ